VEKKVEEGVKVEPIMVELVVEDTKKEEIPAP